jgi:hypothetical protein
MDATINCPCPPKADGGARHPDGDTVTLKETLDFRSVTAIRTNISMLEDGSNIADIMATLTEGYLIYGIASWTLVDEKNKPVPVTRAAITDILLADIGSAAIVGDAADEVFGEKVLLPLLNRAGTSSPPTPMEPTSVRPPASTPSSVRPPRRSKPSSISTIPTDDTETTSSSLAGVSNSSQSSASAA